MWLICDFGAFGICRATPVVFFSFANRGLVRHLLPKRRALDKPTRKPVFFSEPPLKDI